MPHPRLLKLLRDARVADSAWRQQPNLSSARSASKPCVFLVAALLHLFGVATSASAGVLVGNEWSQLPTIAREAYVVGTIDAWQVVDAVIDEPTRSLPVGIFPRRHVMRSKQRHDRP